MKLYRNNNYPTRWFAFSRETGWTMFPAEVGGWAKRQPVRGLDPIHLREVPLRLAFNTGIPGTPAADVDGAFDFNFQLGAAA